MPIPSAESMDWTAKLVQHNMPKDSGMILLIYPKSSPGFISFAATGDRATQVQILRDAADSIERGSTMPLKSNN